MSNLPKYIKTFSRLEVAVIGDLMLDKYIFGSATRISQEAPVPVVCVDSEKSVPGGAANVALNVLSLHAKAHVFGIGNRTALPVVVSVCQLPVVNHVPGQRDRPFYPLRHLRPGMIQTRHEGSVRFLPQTFHQHGLREDTEERRREQIAQQHERHNLKAQRAKSCA